jgi:5-(carboxyamino)imidazole ribonucleotide synthase
MRVGILGGGQLGAMLADALGRLGVEPAIYDPDPAAPALLRAADRVVAAFDDVDALRRFCERCDVVTYEREDLPVDALRATGAAERFVPGLRALEVAQDRALEKAFLSRHGIACVRHAAVPREARLDEASEAFGLPAIAKTTRGGYDGKGQFFLRSPADAAAAQAAIPGAAWILEEPLAGFVEASCIVARSASEEAAFPVVENLHRDHILDRSVLPSRLPREVEARAREVALAAARALDLRGLLAVELFVTGLGAGGGEPRVLVNEVSPRPHNSGHLLSRACTFGQFDALARVLVGAPLGAPALVPGAFCMGNLLGDVWLAQRREGLLDLAAWRAFPDVIDVQIYGKRGPAPRRKMGHFIARTSSPGEALARAEAFRRALSRAPAAA